MIGLVLYPPPPSPPTTLDDVLARVRNHYPKARAAALDRVVAEAKALEKQGAFDPTALLDASTLRYNSSTSPGNSKSTLMMEATIETALPSGAKLFAGRRLNLGDPKSPATATGLLGETFVGVKVPLWRDLDVNEKSIAARQAAIGKPLADEAVRLQTLDVLSRAAVAYWEWAAALRKESISEEALRLASVRASQIARRVAVGDTAEIESVEANAEVKRREASLAKARRDRIKAALKLESYLWTTDGERTEPPAGDPDDLESGAIPQIDEATIVATALKSRPEVRIVSLNRDVVELSERLAHNDRRPALDLTLIPGYDAGAGGVGTTVKAGVFYSVPLRTRGADGRLTEARAKLAKLDLEAKLVERQIALEVKDALSAHDVAQARLTLVREELELTERLESGERVRYERGEGTLFLLNQRERATVEARAKLIDAFADLRVAEVARRVATAEILDGGSR